MSKTIAVVGATGAQGGSVTRAFLKLDGWKVRAITRNTSSDGAKKLASEGAEVVAANSDDEASLVKAFEVRATYLSRHNLYLTPSGGHCHLRRHQFLGVSVYWEHSDPVR